MMNVYEELKNALRNQILENNLSEQHVSIRCKALSAQEAIGNPEQHDYPIVKGKEVMVEASFKGSRGQAFTDEFENADFRVDDLLTINLDSDKKRASFISGLNAVFRYLNLCDKTIHCKDTEPKECAKNLPGVIGAGKRVLLVGYQPRFLEMLASTCTVRVVDLDQDNIGSAISGVVIEPPEMTEDALQWCNQIVVTGSTLVNGTITNFFHRKKPVLFYGVTISAAAAILHLNKFCHCGR